MRAAVIGAGTVGRATTLVLQRGEWACFYWDVRAELSTGIWEQVVAADAVVFCLSGMRSVKEDSASVVDLVAKLEADGYRGGYVQRTTCLPGTAQGVIDALQLGDRYVVWPEFLREATWERDALAPHRVVYGCDAGTASRGIHGRLATCVARAMTGLRPTTLIVTPTEAEVGKLASNAAMAVRVSFANEMWLRYGEHWSSAARRIVETDPRIRSFDAEPGWAWGKKCLPKDLWAAMHSGTCYEGDVYYDGVLAGADRINGLMGGERR